MINITITGNWINKNSELIEANNILLNNKNDVMN